MKQWEQELWQYRLPTPPPQLPHQTCIERYLTEGDDKYLVWFLHNYEKRLNDKIKAYVQEYAMVGHFADLKQAYILGMLLALQHYDLTKGVPFLIYKEKYCRRAIDDYIRTMRKGFSVPTGSEYSRLKKVMALYGETGYKNDAATIEMIAAKTGQNPKKVQELMESGLRNMQFTAFYRRYADDDGEEASEEIAPDPSSEPDRIYARISRSGALHETFDRLDYRERAIVSARLGLCMDCWSTKYPEQVDGEIVLRQRKGATFVDIAAEHMISAATAERIYRSALKKIHLAYLKAEK